MTGTGGIDRIRTTWLCSKYVARLTESMFDERRTRCKWGFSASRIFITLMSMSVYRSRTCTSSRMRCVNCFREASSLSSIRARKRTAVVQYVRGLHDSMVPEVFGPTLHATIASPDTPENTKSINTLTQIEKEILIRDCQCLPISVVVWSSAIKTARLQGSTQAIRQADWSLKAFSRMYWGTCVVLPLPTPPLMTTTWWWAILQIISWRWWYTGRFWRACTKCGLTLKFKIVVADVISKWLPLVVTASIPWWVLYNSNHRKYNKVRNGPKNNE